MIIYTYMLVMFLVGNPPKKQLQKDVGGSSNNAACFEPGPLGMPGQSGTAHLGKMSLSQAPGLLVFTENT